jgi:long-chain acyl-CoA synthetase
MRSIPELFRETAQARAGQALVVFAGRTASFAEVDRRSDAVAVWLAQRGIVRGDRLALYCINGDGFAVAYLGILKAGAVVVPINLLLNPREVAFILNDAGARGIFYHAALAQSFEAVRGQVGSLELSVRIGDEEAAGFGVSFGEVSALGDAVPELVIDPTESLAAILYTSGTTGRPKGAMLSHANLVANTRGIVRALCLSPEHDRLLVVLPMFHAFAATVGMLTPMLHGLSFAPVPRFEPGLVCDAIEATDATIFLGVPSMYNVLLRQSAERVAQWRSVRFAVSGGAALPAELMRRFEDRFGIPVLEGDGPTECSPVTCVNPLEGPRKPGSVGLAIPQVEIEILDEKGRRQPRGEIGEICVRGPNVMKGYWKLPDATAETFFGDWLRTGDLGYKDEDDYVFIVDRKKDMIIVNGMNVYPRVVEEVLYQHPGLAEAAVVGEPDALHGEVPVAYVVPLPGAAIDVADVKAFCRESLGRHEVPRRVVIVDALPKNGAGKVLKRELRRGGEIERGIDARRDV